MPLCLIFLCQWVINSCVECLYFPSLSFASGEEKGRCFTIEYVMPTNFQMTSESTVSVLSK